jgi:hypothetical protein
VVLGGREPRAEPAREEPADGERVPPKKEGSPLRIIDATRPALDISSSLPSPGESAPLRCADSGRPGVLGRLIACLMEEEMRSTRPCPDRGRAAAPEDGLLAGFASLLDGDGAAVVDALAPREVGPNRATSWSAGGIPIGAGIAMGAGAGDGAVCGAGDGVAEAEAEAGTL